MKKAASRNSRIHSVPARSRVINFPRTTEASQFEQDTERRRRELTEFIADLSDSGYGFLLAEEPATKEGFDELRVKEAALRWIVRVARHSSGAVREKLWLDIEDAVTSLEKTAELLLHSELIWPDTTTSNLDGRLADPGRI